MKKIEGIIQNKKVTAVEEALRKEGVSGMTVYEVKGFGNEQTRPDSYLFLPKTKIEIYCDDDQVDHFVEVIMQTCRTGQLGDGKIAVLDVQELVRIRTGERGQIAV